MKFCLILVLSLFVFSACKKKEIVKGCTNGSAVNYNPKAKHDDGSCHFIYPVEGQIEWYPYKEFQYNNNYVMGYSFIAVKNMIDMTSNFGYEGEGSWGSAYSYNFQLGSLNGAPYYFTEAFAPMSLKDCNSKAIDLINLVDYSLYNSEFGDYNINFECNSFYWSWGDVTNNFGFISVGKINSGDINASNGYTLEFDGISNFEENGTLYNRDSVYFSFKTSTNTLNFCKPLNGSNSVFFSANELAGIGTGKGYIRIFGIKCRTIFVGSIPRLYQNQTIRTKKVNFY